MSPEEIPEALDALLEPSEAIGNFNLTTGFGPKPIDFGPVAPGALPSEGGEAGV